MTAPTLRPDGSILDQPGYDAATGIYYDPCGLSFDIPSNPTREDALAALDDICGLLGEFPFVAQDGKDATGIASASRSVVLSYILTALVRRSLPTSPIHGFSATEAGTGKGKLVQIGAAIGIGHKISATPFNESPEEFEKSISASLLAGALVIPLDNLEGEFSNALLCAATTEQVELGFLES